MFALELKNRALAKHALTRKLETHHVDSGALIVLQPHSNVRSLALLRLDQFHDHTRCISEERPCRPSYDDYGLSSTV